jgi:hypothetical protein
MAAYRAPIAPVISILVPMQPTLACAPFHRRSRRSAKSLAPRWPSATEAAFIGLW